MRKSNYDPKEILQKEYNNKLYYRDLISRALSQGQRDVVYQFLENVPNIEKKGKHRQQRNNLV